MRFENNPSFLRKIPATCGDQITDRCPGIYPGSGEIPVRKQDDICLIVYKINIYTIDVFSKRNATLAKEIKQLQMKEQNLLQQQKDGSQQEKIVSRLIPATQHILDNYSDLTVEEKNQLWKLVMKKATVYRSQDDALTVKIYPNLPK